MVLLRIRCFVAAWVCCLVVALLVCLVEIVIVSVLICLGIMIACSFVLVFCVWGVGCCFSLLFYCRCLMVFGILCFIDLLGCDLLFMLVSAVAVLWFGFVWLVISWVLFIYVALLFVLFNLRFCV